MNNSITKLDNGKATGIEKILPKNLKADTQFLEKPFSVIIDLSFLLVFSQTVESSF